MNDSEIESLRELLTQQNKKIDSLEKQINLCSEFLQRALESIAEIDQKMFDPTAK